MHAAQRLQASTPARNLLVAEATAREIGQVSLVEALELTALIARKAPRRHPGRTVSTTPRFSESRG
jgi:hypothetical protein